MLRGGEGVAVPAHQRAAHVVQEAHEAPGHGVVLGVQADAQHRTGGGAGAMHRHDAQVGAQAEQGLPLAGDPAAHGVGALVVRAGHDGRVPGQAQLLGHLRQDGAQRGARGNRRGQAGALQAGGRQQLLRPVAAVQVEQQAAVGQGVVHRRLCPPSMKLMKPDQFRKSSARS